MAEKFSPFFDDVLRSLEASFLSVDKAEPLLQAFVAWLNPDVQQSSTTLAGLAVAAEDREGASWTYRETAVLGFALSVIQSRDDFRIRFCEGLDQMQGRLFFVSNRPLSFEVDGLALIGFAVGILSLEGDKCESAKQWLSRIISDSLRKTCGGKWEESLIEVANLLIGQSNALSGTQQNMDADLLAALAAKGLFQSNQEIERAARETILLRNDSDKGLDRAAVQFFALRWLLRVAARAVPSRASIRDLIAVLEATSSALRRWTWEDQPRTRGQQVTPVRWDVQNEYHVQNLLWVILAPIFPDLEDEEYLHSLGHKHPRCDLAIPSLQTIIEVKYISNGTQSELAKVIEEVSADTGLYLTNPSGYSQIIAFIWDNSRRTEQHAELKQGLLRLRGITAAVIIPRPGGWLSFPNRKAQSPKAKI